MNKQRRLLIKGSAATATLGTAIAAGLITPSRVFANNIASAFKAKSTNDVVSDMFPGKAMENSSQIKIKAPDIAENGAVVPISVSSSLANVDSISILVEKNATPLVASFEIPSNAESFVSTRIKMGKTSNVIAIAKVGNKLYSSSKEVKVTIGGCGG